MPEQLMHTRAARFSLGVNMCDKEVDERGKLVMEVHFLSQVLVHKSVVVMKNKERMLVLADLFQGCRFVLVGRNIHDESYDPEHPQIQYRYTQKLDMQLAHKLHSKYTKVIYMADCESMQAQDEAMHVLCPHCALLQLVPPFCERFYKGKLFFPVFTMSRLCGVVYVHVTASTDKTTHYNIKYLHEELCAYHLLTRGYTGFAFDELVEKLVFMDLNLL